MESPSFTALSPDHRTALHNLANDLRRIFGTRLQSIVTYGISGHQEEAQPLHTLVLVDALTFEDLAVCVGATESWRQQGLATPLLLPRDEFRRTLDVFPLEYGDIIAHHVRVEGDEPFRGIRIAEADLRRACELQAKSHLIHLREGFLETAGRPAEIARLIAASAAPFRTVLRNIARLENAMEVRPKPESSMEVRLKPDTTTPAATHEAPADDVIAAVAERQIGIPAALVREVLASPSSASTIADPTVLLARYVAAAERVWQYVDRWRV